METKREFHLFEPFKINHWLSHIEYMASQGFALSKMNDFFWTYQKIPPENRTYTAVSTGSIFYLIAPNSEQHVYLKHFKMMALHHLCKYITYNFSTQQNNNLFHCLHHLQII